MLFQSPDHPYQAFAAIAKLWPEHPANALKLALQLALNIDKCWCQDTRAVAAHLLLYNAKAARTSNIALRQAIWTTALCHQQHWAQQQRQQLIAATLLWALVNVDEDPDPSGSAFSPLAPLAARYPLLIRLLNQTLDLHEPAFTTLHASRYLASRLAPTADRPGLLPKVVLQHAYQQNDHLLPPPLIRQTAQLLRVLATGAVIAIPEHAPMLVLARLDGEQLLCCTANAEGALKKIAIEAVNGQYPVPAKQGRALLALLLRKLQMEEAELPPIPASLCWQPPALAPPAALIELQGWLMQDLSITKLGRRIDQRPWLAARLQEALPAHLRASAKNSRGAIIMLGLDSLYFQLASQSISHLLHAHCGPSGQRRFEQASATAELVGLLAKRTRGVLPARLQLLCWLCLSEWLLTTNGLLVNTAVAFETIPSAVEQITGLTAIEMLPALLERTGQWQLNKQDQSVLSAVLRQLPGDMDPQTNRMIAVLQIAFSISHHLYAAGRLNYKQTERLTISGLDARSLEASIEEWLAKAALKQSINTLSEIG